MKTWVGTCQVRKLNKTNLVKHGFHTFLRCWGLDGKLGKNKPPLCKILADLGVSKFQIFDFQGVQALRRTRYKEALTEIIKHVDTCCASQIICVSAMCADSIYKSINICECNCTRSRIYWAKWGDDFTCFFFKGINITAEQVTTKNIF